MGLASMIPQKMRLYRHTAFLWIAGLCSCTAQLPDGVTGPGSGGGGGGVNNANPAAGVGGSGVVIVKQAAAHPTHNVAPGVWSTNDIYNNVKAGTWSNG